MSKLNWDALLQDLEIVLIMTFYLVPVLVVIATIVYFVSWLVKTYV